MLLGVGLHRVADRVDSSNRVLDRPTRVQHVEKMTSGSVIREVRVRVVAAELLGLIAEPVVAGMLRDDAPELEGRADRHALHRLDAPTYPRVELSHLGSVSGGPVVSGLDRDGPASSRLLSPARVS